MRTLPEKNSDYGRVEYWEERFSKEETYDWCHDYYFFENQINSSISKDDKILIIGCGNSLLGPQLYDNGFTNIVNIDFSKTVIQNMKEKYSQKYPKMTWLIMDMLNLEFPKDTFDVVLEKGTIDVLYVGEHDYWNPSDDLKTKSKLLLDGVDSILKPTGKLISITFGQPHFRKLIFDKEEYSWKIDYIPVGDSFHYFYYILQKE